MVASCPGMTRWNGSFFSGKQHKGDVQDPKEAPSLAPHHDSLKVRGNSQLAHFSPALVCSAVVFFPSQ